MESWKFNNEEILYVISNNRNIKKGTYVLNCYADDSEGDPRLIIDKWLEYEAMTASGKMTIGDGFALQAMGSNFYELTNNVDTWSAVLSKVKYSEDQFSDELILFQLEFLVTESGIIGYDKEYVPAGEYSNMVFSQYIDNTWMSKILEEHLGVVTIVESDPIKQVDIIGGAERLPSYFEVNGERKYWHQLYSEVGAEKLSFFIPSAFVVTIKSPRTSDDVGSFGGSQINAICITTLKEGTYLDLGV
jgi:hypothetical protein